MLGTVQYLMVVLLRAVKSPLTYSNPMNERFPICPVLNSPAQLLQTLACELFKEVIPSRIWSFPFLLPSTFHTITVFSKETVFNNWHKLNCI